MLALLLISAIAPIAAVAASAVLRGGLPVHAVVAQRRTVAVAAVLSLAASSLVTGGPAVAEENDMHVFSGTVTTDDGTALANIRVSVFCENCPDGSSSDPAGEPTRPWPPSRRGSGARLLGEATTSASGDWSVTVAEPASGSPFVVAWDPVGDYAFAVLLFWESWMDRPGLDASLADGGTLSGHILADGGAPPAGDFILTGLTGPPYMYMIWRGIGLAVAADGSYRTPGLPDGDYVITYPEDLAGPYVAGGSFSLGTISGGQNSVVDHHLVEYASLSGRVTDGSGRGLSGIEVIASPVGAIDAAGRLLASPVGRVSSAVTTDDGTYSFDSVVPGVVPGGTVVIVFQSPDGEYAVEYYDNESSRGEADRLELPREGVSGIDAQLATGGTVSGHVRDAEDQPATGAGVTLCPELDRYNCHYRSTDESGFFEFRGLAAASYIVSARPSYSLPRVEETVVLAEGGHVQVELGVRQGAFSDDDDAFYEAPFDALAERGIFVATECADGRICPEDAIMRATLAVWLGRALTGEEPPSTQTTRFADVNSGDWQAAHIERFAELGVTSGCGDGTRYCPNEAVNRGQMAAFLVRAFELPDAASAGFADTVDHFFANDIDALAAAGITKGCTVQAPPRYCPNQQVTRGQMATFIARALGLA